MNKLDFAGRTAAITGGAMGIGLAVAQRLAQSGAHVALWDRDEARAGAGEGRARRRGATWQLDVADAAAVARVAQATAQAHGGIDVLVCSAGITGPNVAARRLPGR